DGPVAPTAGAAPRAVVLQPAAYAVGHLEVVAQVVQLAHSERGGEGVAAALVERDADAAVIPHDHAIGVYRVDPHGVVVDVDTDRGVDLRLAAVGGDERRRRRAGDAV